MRGMFTKYITAFAAILVMSFFMLLYIVTTFINSYAFSSMKSSLTTTFTAAKQITDIYVETGDKNAVYGKAIEEKLKSVCLGNGNVYCLVDGNGEVISTNSSEVNTQYSFSPSIFGNRPETTSVTTTSDLNGFLKNEHYYMYTSFTGDEGSDTDKESKITAVLLVFNENYVNEGVSGSTISTLITAALWIVVIALLIVYFVTERIVRPLREISDVANEYALGNFKPRVKVVGDDETSDVATAFNKMADALERLEQMRSSFLANVSHDLRTPMTTIDGFVNGIIDGTIPPERQSYYLGIISGEVRRLSRLVSTLLDISKLESGQIALKRSDFNLSEVARQVIISCESRIDRKKLDIAFENDNDVIVNADRDAIHKVIYNLLDNAIKFSGEGGTVLMSITVSDAAHLRKARFSVRNGGAGIPPEEVPFLFERFYKSDRSRGLDKTGTGLGLYIVKTTLLAHGEDISVTSSPEKGTEFVFTLPVTGIK